MLHSMNSGSLFARVDVGTQGVPADGAIGCALDRENLLCGDRSMSAQPLGHHARGYFHGPGQICLAHPGFWGLSLLGIKELLQVHGDYLARLTIQVKPCFTT
jgi:hypothetical protein